MNFFKKEVKNNKIILLTGIIMIMIITYLAVIISGNIEEIWPTKDILFKQKRDYRRLKKELQNVQKTHDEFMNQEKLVEDKVKEFYRDNEKLKADIYMRQRIEHAAKFANLILKSTSSVREKKIKDGTFSIEISINADGSFDKVATFFQELNKGQARIYWTNCYLRPSKDIINISGVLRMIYTDGNIFDVKETKAK